MILLDTDHLTILGYANTAKAVNLNARLEAAAPETAAATVVSYEEHVRGALAEINRHRELDRQVVAYQRLVLLAHFYRTWLLVPFDAFAAEQFQALRRDRVRCETRDLRIAAIALANDALLLTANRRDFEKVPGLRFENWLEP